jgi:small subunit ribosomal protein S8
MMSDPLADMLTRIRNAGRVRHAEVACPSSKLKHAVARVLQEEGFLKAVCVEARAGHPTLKLSLRYTEEGRPVIDVLRRVSKPGRRVYVGGKDVPSVRNGLGVAVLSTSKGILSDRAARDAAVGGEVLCEVW